MTWSKTYLDANTLSRSSTKVNMKLEHLAENKVTVNHEFQDIGDGDGSGLITVTMPTGIIKMKYEVAGGRGDGGEIIQNTTQYQEPIPTTILDTIQNNLGTGIWTIPDKYIPNLTDGTYAGEEATFNS